MATWAGDGEGGLVKVDALPPWPQEAGTALWQYLRQVTKSEE